MSGPQPRTHRIAHAYGNSTQALSRALRAAVDLVEADIWYRAGRLYVRHEQRLGWLPLLADRLRPEHRLPRFALRIGRRYFVRPDVRPLRLEKLLGAANGSVRLLLDTKGSYTPAQTGAFAQTLARSLREHGRDGAAAVCGQNFDVLDAFRRSAPEIEVRYSIERPEQWERFRAMAETEHIVRRICMHHHFLDEEKADFIRQKEVHVYCWTVNDPVRANSLVASGVNGIISDNLSLLARL